MQRDLSVSLKTLKMTFFADKKRMIGALPQALTGNVVPCTLSSLRALIALGIRRACVSSDKNDLNRREAEGKVKGTQFPCGVWGKAPIVPPPPFQRSLT